MKYLSLLFITVMSFMNAQHQRFTYEYRFAKNGNQLDSLKTEMMVLDVTEKGSEFYSWDKQVGDSIMQAEIKKQMKKGSFNINLKGKKTGSIHYKVSKKYPDFTIDFLDKFGGHTYQVKDTRPMNWKISPEKKKIAAWECQKATTTFAGRKWDAWFTSVIPIADGPYKFRGLPGLIVRLECENSSHSFQLVGVKKLPKKVKNSKNEFESLDFLGGNKKAIKINLKKYAKQKQKYIDDPSASFRQMLSSGNVKIISKDGKPMNNAEFLRSFNKNKGKTKRNPIELNLLK